MPIETQKAVVEQKVKAELRAVVIHPDGRREDLGVIASTEEPAPQPPEKKE
jgi:hypothetical protein